MLGHVGTIRGLCGKIRGHRGISLISSWTTSVRVLSVPCLHVRSFEVILREFFPWTDVGAAGRVSGLKLRF